MRCLLMDSEEKSPTVCAFENRVKPHPSFLGACFGRIIKNIPIGLGNWLLTVVELCERLQILMMHHWCFASHGFLKTFALES